MIYDRIENITLYKGISVWLDQALDFIDKTDLTALPLGRTEICEDHVFVNVMEAETLEEDKVNFEIHKKYMDIQIDLEGTERFLVGMEKEQVVDAFREDIDFGTFTCSRYADCILGPGRFVICMAEEPHKPTLAYGSCEKIKKCVIKVEVS